MSEPRTLWSVIRDTSPRRSAALLLCSLLLHLLLTPLGALLGLGFLVQRSELPPPPEEELNAISVSIFDELEATERPATEPGTAEPPSPAPLTIPEPGLEPSAERAPKNPVPRPSASVPPPAPSATPPKPAARPESSAQTAENDAGAPWPAERPVDAPPERPEDAALKAESLDPNRDGEAALRKVRGKNTLTPSNANVELVLFHRVIRAHPTGKQVGSLLRQLPQWRSFFAAGSVDPIRDLDTLHLSGPQFRDSSNISAIIRHHLPADTARNAVQVLVDNPGRKGHWLEGTRVPAAIAWADRAERVFVLSAAQQMVVAPPALASEAEKPLPLLPESAGEGVAVVAKLVTPHRIFLGTPLEPPPSFQTIKTLRIVVTTGPTGAVRVELRGDDISEEQAKVNQRGMEEMLNGLVGLAGLANLADGLGRYFGGGATQRPSVPASVGLALTKAKVRSSGKVVLVDLELQAAEVAQLLLELEQFLEKD